MPEETRGILGDKGSCKTLFMVFLAAQTVEENGEIGSNIRSLQLPQMFVKFNEAADIISKGLGQKILGGKTLFFDELGKGADSYDFFLETPRKISELVFEIRKYKSLFYYSAQRLGTVAKRIREQTDYFFNCEPIEAETAEFTAFDWELLNADKHPEFSLLLDGRIVLRGQAHIVMTGGMPDYRIITEFDFDGRPYFHLYDTHEVIGM